MKNCPVCGYTNPDDAVFCQHCGSMINQTFPQSSDSVSKSQTGNGGHSYDLNTAEALYSLRSALFFIFLGLILSIIPFVGIVGEVILLIGAIKLIIALGKMSKTQFPSASKLKRTRNWLIAYFTIGVVGAVLSIGVFITIISSLFSIVTAANRTVVTNGTVVTPAKLNSLIPSLSIILIAILILELLSFIIGLIFYFSLGHSLTSLGQDLSNSKVIRGGKRIVTATIIFIVGLIFSVVTFFGIMITLLASKSLQSVPKIPPVIIAPLIITIIVLLAAYIIYLMGLYSAYSGLGNLT